MSKQLWFTAALSSMTLLHATAQAPLRHWEIAGAPVVTVMPERTGNRYHLKNIRVAGNDLTPLTEIVGKNERAVIQWSWDNPRGRITPGEVIRLSARCIISEMVGTQ